MTPEREKHLSLQIDTIRDPAEMVGFIKGLKESNEYNTTMMALCRGRLKDLGFE